MAMKPMNKFLLRFDSRLYHDDIDEFLAHLDASVSRRLKSLHEEELNLNPEQFEEPDYEMDAYREHLGELAGEAVSARELGDELSIIALYKRVEAHTGRVIKRCLPAAAAKKLSYYKVLLEVVPFITDLDGFSGFNELRLLNNAIKHEGVVSDELAREFPQWKEGEPLTELNKVYERLLPEVKKYISALAARLHSTT